MANDLIQNAFADGDLEKAAQQSHPNSQISSASAWFDNNTMVVKLSGTLVDECPLGMDLDFTLTHTVSLRFPGSSIEIDQNDSIDLLDLSNLAAC